MYRSIATGRLVVASQLLTRLSTQAAQSEAAAALEAAGVLCMSCAEHLQLAKELRRAARQHEGAVRELRHRILRLLLVLRGEPVEHKSRYARSHRGERGLVSVSLPERAALPDDQEVGPANAAQDVPGEILSAGTVGPSVTVKVAILGPLEVSIQGERVSYWGSQKSRTLFQYLVLHADRPVRREVLMEFLWPGHSPGSARNNLNVSLYALRQSLQQTWSMGQYIVYRGGCYMLNPDLKWVIDRDLFLSDAQGAQFEVLAGHIDLAIDLYERALATYRGQLLEDDSNSEWFEVDRQSLHERHLQALDELAELSLRQGNVDKAHSSAQRILSYDACRESAHRILMRCHSQQQQQGLVARQFRQCIAALDKDLGVGPAEETVRLFRELATASDP